MEKDFDELLARVNDLDVTMKSIMHPYYNGYKAGIEVAKLIIDEDRQFEDNLLNDLEKKQGEIYSDAESLTDEEAKERGIDDDYCEGWYQAFEDILNLLGIETIEKEEV